MLSLFFKDLLHYKEMARAALATLPMDEHNRVAHLVLVGKQPHYAQIKERTDFLTYVTNHSTLMLSAEQLDTFWDCEVQHALAPEERDLAFDWLENARATQVRRLVFYVITALATLST
jgi:ubiquitin carboxyl-terminal hydrolase 9/24